MRHQEQKAIAHMKNPKMSKQKQTVIHKPQMRTDTMSELEARLNLQLIQEKEERYIPSIYTPKQQERNYQLLERFLIEMMDLQEEPHVTKKMQGILNKTNEYVRLNRNLQMHPTRNFISFHLNWLHRVPPNIRKNMWIRLRQPSLELLNILGHRGRIRRSKRAASPHMQIVMTRYLIKYNTRLCMSRTLLTFTTRLQLMGRYVLALMNCLKNEE